MLVVNDVNDFERAGRWQLKTAIVVCYKSCNGLQEITFYVFINLLSSSVLFSFILQMREQNSIMAK